MSQLVTSNYISSVPFHADSFGGEQSYAISTLDGEIALHAGVLSTDARYFFSAQRVERWVLLTAANPHGIALSAAANRQRHEVLRGLLREQGYRVFEATAIDYDARHPALLVAELPVAQATDLARCFAQSELLAGDQRGAHLVSCTALDFSI